MFFSSVTDLATYGKDDIDIFDPIFAIKMSLEALLEAARILQDQDNGEKFSRGLLHFFLSIRMVHFIFLLTTMSSNGRIEKPKDLTRDDFTIKVVCYRV